MNHEDPDAFGSDIFVNRLCDGVNMDIDWAMVWDRCSCYYMSLVVYTNGFLEDKNVTYLYMTNREFHEENTNVMKSLDNSFAMIEAQNTANESEQLLQGQEIWLSYWFFVQTKGWWWCKTFFNFTVYATALPGPCVALSTDMMNSCQLRPSTYGLTLIINKGTHICTKWRKLTWFGSRPYNYDYFLEFIYI